MMEAQDMRITRLEDIMATAVSNQTQILRILQEQSQRQDEQSTLLREHSRILREHSRILQDHSSQLENLNERTGNLEQLMTRVLEELVAIKEILASPRGMGFAPEPD